MIYVLAWYASVVLAACPNGPHEPPVRPQVGELAPEAADRQLADAARRNRSLSDVLMTPSREWVAFVVGSYCVDPNAPGGIRWKLAHGDIEAAIGPGIRGAAFLQQRGRAFRSLPLFVHRPVDADVSRTYLLLLSQKDGTIERQYSLPFDPSWPEPPILSPDYKRLVFLHQDILFMGRPPATAEEVGAADFILQFRVVDLESGTFRDTKNHYGRLPLGWLHGFLDGERVLLSDDRALWTLDTGNLRLRELFRLAE